MGFLEDVTVTAWAEPLGHELSKLLWVPPGAGPFHVAAGSRKCVPATHCYHIAAHPGWQAQGHTYSWTHAMAHITWAQCSDTHPTGPPLGMSTPTLHSSLPCCFPILWPLCCSITRRFKAEETDRHPFPDVPVALLYPLRPPGRRPAAFTSSCGPRQPQSGPALGSGCGEATGEKEELPPTTDRATQG